VGTKGIISARGKVNCDGEKIGWSGEITNGNRLGPKHLWISHLSGGGDENNGEEKFKKTAS